MTEGASSPPASESAPAILTADQLADHARALAKEHDVPSRAGRPKPLLASFKQTRAAIARAYQALHARPRKGLDGTPAEEWLLDNSHVVDEQLREIEEDLPQGYLVKLPRLTRGPLEGLPRVYALGVDFVSHTDARVDLETLAPYVLAYQEVHTLTIGELWAVPIMLRLALAERLRALAEDELTSGDERARADAWMERISKTGPSRSTDVVVALADLAQSEQELRPAFLAQLLRRLRDQDGVGAAQSWIQERCVELGTTPDDVMRREHRRQSAAQLSTGNTITSMRAITALDWADFFERVSAVERTLRGDPAGVYAHTDAQTRDRCRHAVEDVAERSDVSEEDVARAVLELAQKAPPGTPDAHVGYYLLDDGLAALTPKVGYRPKLRVRFQSALKAGATPLYLGGILALTAAATGGIVAVDAAIGGYSPGRAALLAAVALIPASELVVTALNWLVMLALAPRTLPKLAFEHGIPTEHRTLVVVPSMIRTPDDVAELLADLEVRALANDDEELRYVLLTDFPDADAEELPGEAAVLDYARSAVRAMNEKAGRERFGIFHRRRVHHHVSGRWMGWERKRGKLGELHGLLRGRGDGSFSIVTLDRTWLERVRYVLTLDQDTQLPREVARRLVGTIAHPLNRPILDDAGTRVVRGHGLLQPRVGVTLASTSRSLYARAYAGTSGLDPYTTAVSDVYQDLFAEGVYCGKALYDVDAFEATLEGRIPENALLSHDLFEGLHARAALVSDIEVLDDQPANYAVQASRQHRWTRGDWQLVPWLRGRVPDCEGKRCATRISILGRWKILDNLRRSLLAPALVLLIVVGLFAAPASSYVWVLAALATLIAPVFARLATEAVRRGDSRQSGAMSALFGDLQTNALQAALSLTFLVDSATMMIDAIARTLHRLRVKRRLLEWVTASDAEKRAAARGGAPPRMYVEAAVVVAAFGALAALHRAPWFAAPFAALWAAAPFIAVWVSKPRGLRTIPLAHADRALLRRTARRTWRFFETFVTAADNWLPPDNYQEDPKGTLARRTSPTNIGLYMLSSVAARDFGYLTIGEATTRLEQTLDTIDELEHHEGHLLNWYDTSNCAPLAPKYVSTVDSGNLAAHLWAIAEACEELGGRPIVDRAILDGALDGAELAREALTRPHPKDAANAKDAPPALVAKIEALVGALERARAAEPVSAAPWVAKLDELAGLASSAVAPATKPSGAAAEAADWLGRVARELRAAAAELRALIPDADHATTTDGELALGRLAGSSDAASALLARLERVAERSRAAADGMHFRAVYDDKRRLFSIGCDVVAGRLDRSYYDLLASEARLASFVAVAKGEVPQEHWFRLGRALVTAGNGRALVSWSGSMFEYLMPLLVTKNQDRTLLHETCCCVVERQVQYGAQRGVPWGVSESAYNLLDLGLTYQYRAFGVPGLGLKPGLADDLVIAPYATLLAALVDPTKAAANLRALDDFGALGPYGYYDAIDCTPDRVPPGRKGVVVKTYMAHHQGMGFVALANAILDGPMQRRFHADPRVKATELLLDERVPVVAAVGTPRSADAAAPAPSAGDGELDSVDEVTTPVCDPARAHLLGNGEISTFVSSTGSAWLTWRGLDVTRYRADAALDAWGTFCYLRDLDGKAYWSTTYQPTCRKPDSYRVSFAVDKVTIHRKDGDLEALTEITVSPEHAAELRRVTLTNTGHKPLRIEVTTYAEVVLAARAADAAHPAFGNMFVETSRAGDKDALVAARKPRAPGDATPFAAQIFAVEAGDFGPLEIETDRCRFVGRGRTVEAPAAMLASTPLSGEVGATFDPIFAMRRVVTIPPGGKARFAITTACADGRDELTARIETFLDPHSISRTFELAWTDARVELRFFGLTASQSLRFQRLASLVVVAPDPALRPPPDVLEQNHLGKEGLWRHGISGDLPILVVRLDDAEPDDLVRELVQAHEFWRANGLTVDLVLLNEEPTGYLTPLQDRAMAIVRSSSAQAHLDQRGGVFVRRGGTMPEAEKNLLLATARVVLSSSKGSLAKQLRQAGQRRTLAGAFTPSRPKAPEAWAVIPPPTLAFFNGTGGFTPDGREYVIALEAGKSTPAPWCNVVANETAGFIVSERGAGFTWTENSQTHRLTPWSNDAVSDPAGEAIYLRDEEDGAVWSPTPGPASGDGAFLVRHGQGYSTFESRRGSVGCKLTMFVAPDAPVKTYRLEFENTGPRARKIAVVGYVEWVLGSALGNAVVTEYVGGSGAILARGSGAPFADRVAFFAASAAPRSFTGDRGAFLGKSGSRQAPRALGRATLGGAVGPGLDPCGALDCVVSLAPGESRVLTFVVGEGNDRGHALALAAEHRTIAAADASLAAAIRRWDELLSAVTIETPDAALDVMVNRWLLYQVICCRIWARSAFYQSGGAYGFRDQLQDTLAVLHASPALARAHILRAAARQFKEGDVQHWWHPETGQGVRTRYCDDLVWLPYVVSRYVEATGDDAILDEAVPFLEQKTLEPGEHEIFGVPSVSSDAASLYEHCVRALDKGTTSGPHGLPLMGGGDWNDGMNRVGEKGAGESVWMAWFLGASLRAFADVAGRRGDAARAAHCHAEAARIGAAVDEAAWDGEWYRRAYFDDGTPLGSRDNEACSIDAIAQSWSVISGLGDPARARLAMKATDEHLVKSDLGVVLLFTPPFVGQPSHDPGYIKAYPAGVRENGGQYTHGALWTVLAHATLGDGDKAHELLSDMSPIHHTEGALEVARYRVEPYVVAADIYNAPGHEGRGGWTWYTGSASWMYTIALEAMLGVRRHGDALRIAPCIPTSWERYSVSYRFGKTTYVVTIENPAGQSRGVERVELDGEERRAKVGDRWAEIPLVDDGRPHTVRVVLGARARPSTEVAPLAAAR